MHLQFLQGSSSTCGSAYLDIIMSFEHDILSEACTTAWVTWLLLQWIRISLLAVRRYRHYYMHVPTVVDYGSQTVADLSTFYQT